MFEPLMETIKQHGENIVNRLDSIEGYLARVAGGAEAQVEKIQFLTRGLYASTGSAGVEGEETITLEIRESQGAEWRVRNVAVTGGKEGVCAVYLNAVNGQNLLGVLSPTLLISQSVRWYVPTNGVLLFVFTKQPKNQVCTCSIQAEEFRVSEPVESFTGESQEQIDPLNRIVPEPTPHPDLPPAAIGTSNNAEQ